MNNSEIVVLTNLQARVVRIEKELQIHDATRKKQTARNDEILRLAKEDNKQAGLREDPYV